MGRFLLFRCRVAVLLLLGAAGCELRAAQVLCFYYNWYKTPAFDGVDEHWSHWKNGDPKGYPGGDDIGANFFPALGNYSSNDPAAVAKHMEEIGNAGIDAIFLTWWGRDHFTAESIPVILDQAKTHGVKVGFQIEPYPGRTPATVRDDVKFILEKWGRHPAFYRTPDRGRPLFFVYDSYKSPAAAWSAVLAPGGANTLRGTRWDADFLGLWVERDEQDFFLKSGFDGFYTYFASKVFRYGSDPRNWPEMQRWAAGNGKLFVPCVGPGYIDVRIRPENGATTQDRDGGEYYDDYWRRAIAADPWAVAITSFNEWHEGTQIEPAKPHGTKGFTYLDYSPLAPDFYMKRTRYWADRLRGE